MASRMIICVVTSIKKYIEMSNEMDFRLLVIISPFKILQNGEDVVYCNYVKVVN